MEAWPSGLPNPQKHYDTQLRAGLADAQEQINARRTRTYPERESTFVGIFTQTQFETFKTFYETTLNGGGMLFEADWLSDANFTFHRLRFLGPYDARLKGGILWRVKMKFEIIAGVPLSESEPIYWLCEE